MTGVTHQITDEEYEEFKILKKIYYHSIPEKYPDLYFICGESGEKDQSGLPKYIHVCPAYGADVRINYTYEKVMGGDLKKEIEDTLSNWLSLGYRALENTPLSEYAKWVRFEEDAKLITDLSKGIKETKKLLEKVKDLKGG